MMTEELKVKVSLDTSGLKNGIKQMKDTLSDASSGFSGMDKATANTAKNTQAVTAAMGVMGATTVAQTALMSKAMSRVVSSTSQMNAPLKKYIGLLKDDLAGAFAAFKKKNFDPVGDKKSTAWIGTLKTALKELGTTSALVGKKIRQNLRTAFENASANIKANINQIRLSIAGAVASVTAFMWALLNLSESTREFRQAINQVNTSFVLLGSNIETATAAYQAFYRILGDVQRSAEAANLLAQITTEEKNLVTWTKIATGAMAMFPDSLPTESLIEAANETIKTAKVTGALADALNWPAGAADKISKALEGSVEAQSIFNKGLKEGLTVEDAFNKVLAETNSQTQREVILRSALNGVYSQSAGLYEEMNKELIKQNEAQMRLNQAMSKLGSIVQPVQTAFTNFRAVLAEALAPAIQVLCDWLVKLIGWLTTAAAYVGAFFAVIFPGAAEKISSAFNGVSTSIQNATGGTGGLNNGLEEAEGTAQKLRKALMGFDELNVVSKDSGSGSSTSVSGGVNAGNGIDVSGLDTGDSVFQKAKEQMEDFKEKVRAFLSEWKEEITLIAGALGLWSIGSLLTDFGNLIGLSDEFLKAMKTIKGLAATAITIVLQYSLVNEFMDNYIDGEGFKEYLKGLLVSAIGTGVLYAIWSTPGLTIGLAVTAVASIQSVIENGGITNIESAIVALTGLASAAGAVALAWGPLQTAFNGIKAVIGSLAGNSAATSALAFLPETFTKIAKALQPVVTAVTTFVSGLTTGAILTIAGIIAGIVAVVIFLKENWEAVTAAVKDFFNENIAPKLESIRESFKKMGDALGPVGKAIADVIKAVADWFKEIGVLEAIGKFFEFVGGVIFGAVSGVIAGAINALVSMFDGLVQALSGSVQILTGIITAVVKLFSGDLEGAKDACKKILDGIVDLFKGLYKLIVSPIQEFVNGVINWFVELWDELVGHSVVPDMMDDIVQCFKELPARVIEWVKDLATKVINKLTEMWNNVVQGCKTKLGEARTAVMNGWNSIKSYFTDNIAPKFTLAYWQNKFDTMRSAIQTKLGEFRTQVINSWNSIKSYFNENIAPKFTLNYWKNKFETMKSAASTKLGEVKTTIQNAWNNIKSWFSNNVASKFTVSYWSGKFNTIKDGAKAAFNGIIAVVEKAINGIINKINTLSWKIPDWVPVYGGDRFGFSFKTISIPRLAEGGITTGSTLANIGENGREAVLPLDRNTSWMDSLADKIAQRNNTPTKIVLKVGERELGWATINGINQITKQTGGLQLVL